jgi:hypothetical protein
LLLALLAGAIEPAYVWAGAVDDSEPATGPHRFCRLLGFAVGPSSKVAVFFRLFLGFDACFDGSFDGSFDVEFNKVSIFF